MCSTGSSSNWPREFGPEACPGAGIVGVVQGYIAKKSGAMSTRVRIRGERAYLTLKSPKGRLQP